MNPARFRVFLTDPGRDVFGVCTVLFRMNKFLGVNFQNIRSRLPIPVRYAGTPEEAEDFARDLRNAGATVRVDYIPPRVEKGEADARPVQVTGT